MIIKAIELISRSRAIGFVGLLNPKSLMRNRFCSLFLVFCLLMATLIQSGYGFSMESQVGNDITEYTSCASDNPKDEHSPIDCEHDEEGFQIVDILETEPHLNYPAQVILHIIFSDNPNHFAFIDRCISWHSDNTSPPPEV